MSWQLIPIKKRMPKITNPILIEGLPGIGNVGKIAADFIIDDIKAKKIYELFSYDLPNSVFVNEKNLVELPAIEIFHKKIKNQDFLILTGDVQPTYEKSAYELCETVLKTFLELDGKFIITLGGIGLSEIPPKPAVYCTGNNSEFIEKFIKRTKINPELYGVVGPIIGISGLLLGLGQKLNIDAISLLAETFGHPAYLGINSSKELIKVLDKKLKLGINIKKLEKEITDLEKEIGSMLEGSNVQRKASKLKKIRSLTKETSYIG